ncbi:circadian phase modifier CpmA [Bosea sp. Root381]|uniref:nickel pincer cofactor biosynthesis protein LarB n=1 Tax=Bosea sp. Root381 TaxID=1736524 RepID=UPI0006FAF486|nr:nickel pincer cofactor biosynthesis protein LarB [Bosea sp. Root381]KRE07148.1 circadian phase modifier CpmA [Bosea sp. Root381]
MSAIVPERAVIDWDRTARTGLPEAVYAEGKSREQIVDILLQARQVGKPLLITLFAAECVAELPAELQAELDYDERSRTAFFGAVPATRPSGIMIVAAGLSDMPVVGEAARTLAFCGVGCEIVADVGVAGLWRLLERVEEIRAARLIIAVAGMEGALFSVLAGLVPAPIIAVPTSVGRGVAQGGQVALHSALASCAPGLVCVNVDNGFGAAQAALRMSVAWRQRDTNALVQTHPIQAQ